MHQPHVPTILDVRGCADGSSDEDVAGDDDRRRTQELEYQTEEGNWYEPLRVVLLGNHVAARFVPLQQVDVDVFQQGQNERQEPDPSAEKPTAFVLRWEAGRLVGPRQGQVSLQGHEGQEEWATVEVYDVYKVRDLTKEAAPQPNLVHGHLKHEEGHGEDHHQVGQAHVDDAEQHTIRRMPPSPVHPHHQGVFGQPYHEEH